MSETEINWDELGFGYTRTEAIYHVEGDRGRDPPWGEDQLIGADRLQLSAAAAVLSYGVGIIEGLKVQRRGDGAIVLFRLGDHAARFARSAERMLMLPFPPERFVRAVKQVVRANERFVPPSGRGTFYLRPMEHATEEMLGLRVGSRFAVTIYGSPVGEIISAERRLAGVRLRLLPICRAPVGGTGGAKAIVNYAGVLWHKEAARRSGFDDVLFSSADGTVQETGGANLFCRLRSGALVTPAVDDQTILAGITRDSVLAIARTRGLTIEERPLAAEELFEAGVEAFCTGTAWGVRSIAEIADDTRKVELPERELACSLGAELLAVQRGEHDPFGWTTVSTTTT